MAFSDAVWKEIDLMTDAATDTARHLVRPKAGIENS